MLYRLYGLTCSVDFELPEMPESDGYADIILRAGEPEDSEPATKLYRSRWITAEGEPQYTLYEVNSDKLIDVTKVARFRVSHDVSEVVYRVHTGVSDEVVRTWLLGTVSAFLLEWRGTFCLHAGAVKVDDGCVAFAGFPGAGKSSLVAAWVAAGWPLLSDDIVPLTLTKAGVSAMPGYPGLRLWPELIRRFAGDPASFARIHPDFDKRRVAVGRGWGAFCSTPQLLRAVYILQPATGDVVSVERLARRDAAMALISHSFIDLARDQGLRMRQFDFCASVALQVPVYNLNVPRNLAQLSSAPEQICRLSLEHSIYVG